MDKELNTKITQQDPPRVVTFGEILLRLSAPGYERLLQSPRLEATFGGGEATVAVSLANFGLQSAFITKLPHNALGQAAVNSLRALGVDTGGIVRGGARMGLYFLEKGASQRASVCLYDRAGSAMSQAQPKEFDWPQLLQGASWFHFTGITPALGAPVAEACRAACQAAKAQGVRVSCDLNYRQKLWSRAQANRVLGELCQLADVCICNEADARDVFGIAAPGSNLTRGELDPQQYTTVARELTDCFGFSQVAITLRRSRSASENDWGGLLYTGGQSHFSRTYRLQLVDRVGGGDSFAAGLIYALLRGDDAPAAIEFAAAASALKQSIPGDFNRVSVPEVERLSQGDTSGRIQR